MKTLKRTLLAACLLIGTSAFAQEPVTPAVNTDHYRTAIGLRGGPTSGLTIKHFTSGTRAVEGILGVWNNGFRGTVLFEQHVNAGAPGLHWYYGVGAHASAYADNRTFYVYDNRYEYREGELGIGVDGIIGIEYKIPPIPFALSVDIKPALEVTTDGNVFGGFDPGLGVKFTF